MNLRSVAFLFLLFFSGSLSAQKQINVLTTNSWTTAYARAAGVTFVDQLAPSDMMHPSEYELQISDIKKLKEADYIIYSGYEVVVPQIQKSLKIDERKLIKIETGYTEELMIREIEKIARIVGTIKFAQQSATQLSLLFARSRFEIENAGLKGKPVIVHFFQEAFAREIGLKPIAVFGPSHPELHELAAISEKEAVLIIDNVHNQVAQPISAMKKSVKVVSFLNFPGTHDTQTLEDVILYNLSQLLPD
ncbi:MAG TPA: hypothetical protein PKJ43_01690 [Prolixibacteraceae bacterium]|nr:hypothetical protein [Prolixibacteraceae bacterium]